MKINPNKLFLFFFTVFSLISCSNGGGDDVPNDVPRTGDDVRADFKNLDINSGVNDLTLESVQDNVFWNFRVILPEVASETNKRPLIIRLHGGASNVSPTAHQTTDCLVEPGLLALDAIIVSPNSDGVFWYEQQNQVQILALLDLVSTNLPVDKTKVVIMGYSDGGNGCWFFAQNYPQLFSAAIPMASSYNPFNSDDTIDKIEIPMYVIHGEDDQLFPLNITEDWVNSSIAAGSNIQFVVAPGLSHYQPCDYVDYLKDAALWLENTVWN